MRFRTSTAAALSLLLAGAPALAQTAPTADTPPPSSPRPAPDAPPASDAKPAAGTPPSRTPASGTRTPGGGTRKHKTANKTKAERKKGKKGKKAKKRTAPAATAPASPTVAAPRAPAEEEFATGPQEDESPAIVHTPVGTGQRGKPLTVAARITDASGIFQALVHLRRHGPGDYIPLKMAAARGKRGDYAVEIPEKLVSVDLDYFIEAYDNAGNRATAGTPDRPMVIKVGDEKKQSLLITGGPPRGSGPSITHSPVARAARGQPVEIAARFVGDNGISSPAVLFRQVGEKDYRSLPMGGLGDGTYTATLPATVVTSDLEYYLEAFDKEGNGPGRSGDPTSPYRVTVSGAPVVTRLPGEPQMTKAPFSPNPGRALGWVFMAGFVGTGLFAGGEAYGAWQARQTYQHTFDYEGRLVPGLNDRANQYADRAKKLAIVSGASLLVGIVLLVAFPEHPDRIAPAGADGVAVRF
jgi:hypothetical protein